MKALFVLLFFLAGCTAPNFYQLGIKHYILPIIDVPETKRPLFISEGVFINQSFINQTKFGPVPPIWDIRLVILYSNRTARERSFLSHKKLSDASIDSLLDVFFVELHKQYKYHKISNDTLVARSPFANYDMGPISYYYNDTITISSVHHITSSFNLGYSYQVFNSQYKLDTMSRKLYKFEPNSYYDSINGMMVRSYSISPYIRYISQLRYRSGKLNLVYDFYPYNIPKFEQGSYINYWHPFKIWSSRLDSINAGLRPVERGN